MINKENPSVIEIAPVPSMRTISKIAKTETAVPSLNKLSPSKIRERRCGAPELLNRESAAIGSVAEMSEPNKRK
jgi:hypothetical protein